MNNKVDKLFKEKLETHTLQPSAQAWEKVESHLSKKNKMVVWLRVAAVIVLISAATLVVLNLNEPAKQIVKEKVKENIKSGEQQPTVTPEQKQVAEAPVKKKRIIKQQDTKEEAPAVPEVQPEPEMVAVAEEPAPVIVEEVPQQIKQAEKSITLTYTLPAIKKEEKQAETAVAALDEPKKTGLERVLEIAKEVKNGDPIGELRQAKDDILAFEFKNKDKNKKHN